MAKNSEYWEKRIANENWKVYNSLEEKNRALLDFYVDASESVKQELYQIAEKCSKDGVLSLSDMHKQNRLTKLNEKYEKIIEDLGYSVEESTRKQMQEGFKEVYKNTALAMGDKDFSMPNKKLMEKLLNTPWRGDTFSKRLWKNQKKLAVSLNDILLTGLQQGKAVTEIAITLHNRMGQGFNDCHRLIRTETMHYLNDATLQRYKDAGVKYVQIWAAVDERTCDTCGNYHRKIYPIEKCPYVPLHANCRCTILPVTDEKLIAELDARFKTGGIDKSRHTLVKSMTNGIIKTERQLGKKIGKHAKDYGLNPISEEDRNKFIKIIDDILNHPDEIRYGEWRSQSGESEYYIKGNDVVVINNNRFVTILKGGINNERIKNARK